MNVVRSLLAATAATLPAALAATPVSAQQSYQTWVSRTGDNANNCSEAAPCRTFQRAHDATFPGGAIACLDSGIFGQFTITKSVTITCGTNESLMSVDNLTINAPDAHVVLRGIMSNASTDLSGAYYGLRILNAATVVIEDCVFRDVALGEDYGSGVTVKNASGIIELAIRRSAFTGNKKSGVRIAPTGSASAKVTISDSSFTNNNVGIRAETIATSGRIDLTVVDSVLDGNTYQGLVIEGGVGQIAALASRVSASNNGTQGMRSINGTAMLRISDSDISGNATGIEAINGGIIQSFGNNRMSGNTNASVQPPLIDLR